MTVSQSGHPAFLAGFRRGPIIISAIGGFAFLAGFLVQDVHGLGRALGLCGLGVVLCAFTMNLLMDAASSTDPARKRHLMAQGAFTFILAVAVFLLAAHLYYYGHLPSFMPARYDRQHPA